MNGTESIIGQTLRLIGDLIRVGGSLVNLAVLALICALGWALATSAARAEEVLILAPTGALFTLAILLFVSASAAELAKDRRDHGEVPGGEFVLGCTLGRRTVSCGMLRVRGARAGRIPDGDHMAPFTDCLRTRLPVEHRGSNRLYDQLVEFIERTLYEAQRRDGFTHCSAIGISTPGLVNLQTGQLTLSQTVPEGADIPREIARRLLAKASREIVRSFPTVIPSERQLAGIIYMDNDVRCIARHELSKHGRNHSICLYVGSGVGGGLVVEGQMYYGVHGSAAIVGHLELEAPTGRLQLVTGQQLGPTDCQCGKYGFHLDAFVNYAGLRRITEAVITEEELPTLKLLQQACREAGIEDADFYRDGFPQVVAAAGGRAMKELPDGVRAIVAQDPHLGSLTTNVLRAYVGILAVGIVTITHMFDPGVIVLCGPLVEQLRESDRFARYLRDLLPNRLVDERAMPHLATAVSRDAEWQGAALIAWDPIYHKWRGRPGGQTGGGG